MKPRGRTSKGAIRTSLALSASLILAVALLVFTPPLISQNVLSSDPSAPDPEV